MAVSLTRRPESVSRAADGAARTARSNVRAVLRGFVARPVTGVFVVVPLLGAVLQMGSPERLLTLSGLAAVFLAVDLLLARLHRPLPRELGAQLNLVAWTGGVGLLAAGAWNAAAWQYHGELVVLVGAIAAGGVGLGSPRAAAILWTVAAAAAVALGASLTGPLTAEAGIAAASIAIGVWFGAVIGEIVDRLVSLRKSVARSEDGTSD